jgi:uncharacterized membrane protein YgcG
MVVRSLLTVLTLAMSALLLVPTAMAQGSDTVFDRADVLSDAEEQNVQATFEQVSEESGEQLHAFLVSDTNTDVADRPEFLAERAREADLPPDADVMVVDTEDRWGLVDVAGGSDQEVYDAMVPYFQDGDFEGGLIAGALQYQDSLSVLPELLTTGGVLGALVALAGGALFLRSRRRREREFEEQRRLAEQEFAELTERLDAFGEKERLVSGYLEAQRPLLDQKSEEEVEAKIRDARSAGFGREFNEAAASLSSDPRTARERISTGRRLLDHYRAADEALEGKLRVAADEIHVAEIAERSARNSGAAVEPLDLRPEYDRLAKETADRASRRDEFDPREKLAAVDALDEKARDRRAAMEAEASARAALPEERSSTEDELARARATLEEYGRAYAAAVRDWGPAALEEAPAPEELSTDLRHAAGRLERSEAAEAAGRFAEARSLLGEAAQAARATMQAPGALKAAVAGADRRRRQGEKKLAELEARLERAKANRHRMGPRQRRQIRDYERRLADARSGFFGADWLTALLVFEALDTDYVYVDNPAGFGDGGWGDGGDFGGGDWGGGDFGGGGF